jgi:hypothetical protein
VKIEDLALQVIFINLGKFEKTSGSTFERD